jgi:hypothetical protein
MGRDDDLKATVGSPRPTAELRRKASFKFTMESRLWLLDSPHRCLPPAEIPAVIRIECVEHLVQEEGLVACSPVFVLNKSAVLTARLKTRRN